MKVTQPLQEQAYEYLLDMIKNGTLLTDTIYSLNQMAKEYGFSRTPFRDAVLRLEQERYLDILPSKGFTLHKMTKEDILETYQIRNAIEVFCFKQLSIHLNSEQGQFYYKKLQTKIDQQEEIYNTTGNIEDFARKDYEFHRSLVQFMENESMLEIYRRFMYRIFWLNVTSFSKQGRMEDTITEHKNFLTLVKNQDMIQIEKLVEHHLQTAQEINFDVL